MRTTNIINTIFVLVGVVVMDANLGSAKTVNSNFRIISQDGLEITLDRSTQVLGLDILDDKKEIIWGRFKTFIQQEDLYSEYVLLGFNQMIQKPAIEILGIHEIQIKAGQSSRFENFVLQKWDFLQEVLCMWGLVLKCDRGKDQGKFLWISAFDPGEMRDGYFPQPGVGSELWTQATLPIQKLLDELNSFFVYGPGTEGMYTDYVILK